MRPSPQRKKSVTTITDDWAVQQWSHPLTSESENRDTNQCHQDLPHLDVANRGAGEHQCDRDGDGYTNRDISNSGSRLG